jgi:hypothetical protein
MGGDPPEGDRGRILGFGGVLGNFRFFLAIDLPRPPWVVVQSHDR